MKKEGVALLIIMIVVIVGAILYFINPIPPEKELLCPTDLKLCPNGSYVGRTFPNCSFLECPEPKISDTETEMTREQDIIIDEQGAE